MTRPLTAAATALLSLACGGAPSAPDRSRVTDTAAPSLDATRAAALRERALALAPPGVSAGLTVHCEHPAAWCGYETAQPDNERLSALLDALEQACGEGPLGCSVFLESIASGEDGRKHARIALHPPGPRPVGHTVPPRHRAPGALDEGVAARVVADTRAALPADLRDDLHLRCTPDLGCSLRTEQVDHQRISTLLDLLADRCEEADPPACAVWLTDLYPHPDNGRKVADIALTTAN